MPPWLSTVASSISLTGSSLAWFDEIVAPEVVRFDEADAIDNETELVQLVTGLLYKLFYSVGRPMLWGSYNARQRNTAARAIAQELHAANAGRGRTETDWRYLGPGRGEGAGAIAEKDGLRILVPGALHAGPTVTVEMPAGSFGRSQGFYVAHSNRPFTHDGPIARLYLNVSPAFAAPLMQRVTSVLNDDRLAFDFKIADNTQTFCRCDTAVLYGYRSDFGRFRDLLYDNLVAAGQRGFLREATPAMTLRIAPGVGAADDPGNGDSFGQHRCRLIAQGIVATLQEQPAHDRLQAIAGAFDRSGISLQKPYLNDPTTDPYAHPDAN